MNKWMEQINKWQHQVGETGSQNNHAFVGKNETVFNLSTNS